LQAVLDAVREGRLPIEVAGVIVNNPAAFAIERARAAGVAVEVLPWERARETRAGYDARLLATVAAMRPDIVLLLGWMHLLHADFVGAFPTLLNLHPAFLPLDPERDGVVMPDGTRMAAFRGARSVRDALSAGSAWVGASVHAVTSDTDRGPVLARKPLWVGAGAAEADVMAQLHPMEHRLVLTGVMRALYERE
jgi:phosphoribosylglycinamide formyltransferase-1